MGGDINHETIQRNTAYADDGCELAPHCLTCPLPRCKHDVPLATQRRWQRMIDAQALAAEGLTVQAIAERLGSSERVVHRDLAGGDR